VCWLDSLILVVLPSPSRLGSGCCIPRLVSSFACGVREVEEDSSRILDIDDDEILRSALECSTVKI
jgi:hypothetical protein